MRSGRRDLDLEDDFIQLPRRPEPRPPKDCNGRELREPDRVCLYGQIDAVDPETGEVDLLVELPSGFTNLPIVTVPAVAVRRLQYQPHEHAEPPQLIEVYAPHNSEMGGPAQWRRSIVCFWSSIRAAVSGGISGFARRIFPR